MIENWEYSLLRPIVQAVTAKPNLCQWKLFSAAPSMHTGLDIPLHHRTTGRSRQKVLPIAEL